MFLGGECEDANVGEDSRSNLAGCGTKNRAVLRCALNSVLEGSGRVSIVLTF